MLSLEKSAQIALQVEVIRGDNGSENHTIHHNIKCYGKKASYFCRRQFESVQYFFYKLIRQLS
jgi:hypothetical protein